MAEQGHDVLRRGLAGSHRPLLAREHDEGVGAFPLLDINQQLAVHVLDLGWERGAAELEDVVNLSRQRKVPVVDDERGEGCGDALAVRLPL